jgi:hypothetical protein
MAEYFLVEGDVVMAIRKDHFGDPFYWLVCSMSPDVSPRLFYVNADWCIPLDPALNVLFERNEDGR